MATYVPSKDPNNVEPYHFIWCDRDGTNDGSSTDVGDLQGATITDHTVTVPTGITLDSSDRNAVTIQGVLYSVNTVVTAWLSGGTAEQDYDVLCRVTISDNRTLDKTMTIPCREH